MTPIKFAPPIVLGLLLVLIAVSPTEARDRRCPVTVQPQVVYYPTQYRQGPLLVEITGRNFGVVEAYYKDQAYREAITGATNLHVNRVHLSPGNEGLFAVTYGESNNNFFAIGWTKTAMEPRKITADSAVEGGGVLRDRLPGGGTVSVSWKAERLLRLSTHHASVEYTCILRWKSDSGLWQVLDQQTNSWDNVHTANR